MNETEGGADSRPPIPLPPLPPGLPIGRPPRRGVVSLLTDPLAYVWRRPAQSLCVVVLILLLAGGGGFVGLQLWAEHHLDSARRASDRGYTAAAIEHLRQCRLVQPDRREVLILCARAARRSGSWDEANELLDRYSRLHGDDEALALERLLQRATAGELEAVRPLLRARIDRDDPAAPLAREALVNGFIYRFRLDEAVHELDLWQQRDPDATMALYLRGQLDELRDNTTGAMESYRRLLEIDPEHDPARLKLAGVLLQLSQGEEALAHLEYLRGRRPEDPEVLVRLGQAQDLQRRGDEARAALDECLRLAPDHATALAERGRIALRDDDRQLAEDCLRRSLELDPGDYKARYQYSLTLRQNGKQAEAVKEQESLRQMEADLQRVKELVNGRLQQSPDDPGLHHEIATIALRAGRPREALRWWQSALQLDPNHTPTHRALTSYYYQTGNPVLAARHRAMAQRLGGPKPP